MHTVLIGDRLRGDLRNRGDAVPAGAGRWRPAGTGSFRRGQTVSALAVTVMCLCVAVCAPETAAGEGTYRIDHCNAAHTPHVISQQHLQLSLRCIQSDDDNQGEKYRFEEPVMRTRVKVDKERLRQMAGSLPEENLKRLREMPEWGRADKTSTLLAPLHAAEFFVKQQGSSLVVSHEGKNEVLSLVGLVTHRVAFLLSAEFKPAKVRQRTRVNPMLFVALGDGVQQEYRYDVCRIVRGTTVPPLKRDLNPKGALPNYAVRVFDRENELLFGFMVTTLVDRAAGAPPKRGNFVAITAASCLGDAAEAVARRKALTELVQKITSDCSLWYRGKIELSLMPVPDDLWLGVPSLVTGDAEAAME